MDNKLDSYISSYTKFNDWLINRRYSHLCNYFKGSSCLELGIAEGSGIDKLLDRFNEVTVVDGSKLAISQVQERFKNQNLIAVHSFFEEIDFKGKVFDTIIMAHILEHVDDPILVLRKAKEFLADNGIIIIDVPNGNSLHRQVGVKMGLLNENTELNQADLSIGHQRVYTPETFKKDVEDSGLIINNFGGMFIKVLSNSQMEEVFNEQQLEALFNVGVDQPEIAAEIYIIATKQ